MTVRLLETVLRSLCELGPPLSDAELLQQFLVSKSETAFAELVRRHGRLVWSACRHLTGSDAEADDAFQATFLVLLEKAQRIRDPGKLSAWLHGVAYKVCSRSRQSAKRRQNREQACALAECNGSTISATAWDRALTAVHEEVARLPDSLRVPFVLCCLEGKGTTEAASQLGWKLGTFSGRLTRAKDLILARLDARGLTLGVAASVGLALPPSAVVARAAALARVGVVIPAALVPLTQGVIGMTMNTIKIWAATVVFACGLGLTVGPAWLSNVEAQVAAPPVATASDRYSANEIKRLQSALDLAQQQLDAAQNKSSSQELADVAAAIADNYLYYKDTLSARTARWEYTFLPSGELEEKRFVALLQEQEKSGWDYNGTVPLLKGGKLVPHLVFRRPINQPWGFDVRPATTGSVPARSLPFSAPVTTGPLGVRSHPVPAPATTTPVPSGTRPVSPDPLSGPASTNAATLPANSLIVSQIKSMEAEIDRLERSLAELKSRVGPVQSFNQLPLEPEEMASLMQKLAARKFPGAKYKISVSGQGIVVGGEPAVVKWAGDLIQHMQKK